MSGEIFAAAGSRFFIGGALAPKAEGMVEADFNSIVWKEVGPLEGIGEFGDEAEAVTFDAMDEGRRRKLKGTRDAGDMRVVCAFASNDGQDDMIAAEATNVNFAFKVEFPDDPDDGATSAPTTHLFVGMVMSKRVTGSDSANSVLRREFQVAINSNIVEVAAQEHSA